MISPLNKLKLGNLFGFCVAFFLLLAFSFLTVNDVHAGAPDLDNPEHYEVLEVSEYKISQRDYWHRFLERCISSRRITICWWEPNVIIDPRLRNGFGYFEWRQYDRDFLDSIYGIWNNETQRYDYVYRDDFDWDSYDWNDPFPVDAWLNGWHGASTQINPYRERTPYWHHTVGYTPIDPSGWFQKTDFGLTCAYEWKYEFVCEYGTCLIRYSYEYGSFCGSNSGFVHVSDWEWPTFAPGRTSDPHRMIPTPTNMNSWDLTTSTYEIDGFVETKRSGTYISEIESSSGREWGMVDNWIYDLRRFYDYYRRGSFPEDYIRDCPPGELRGCDGVCSANPTLDDVCGVCGGDNSTCLDCRGVPNGPHVEDECGFCTTTPIEDPALCPGEEEDGCFFSVMVSPQSNLGNSVYDGDTRSVTDREGSVLFACDTEDGSGNYAGISIFVEREETDFIDWEISGFDQEDCNDSASPKACSVTLKEGGLGSIIAHFEQPEVVSVCYSGYDEVDGVYYKVGDALYGNYNWAPREYPEYRKNNDLSNYHLRVHYVDQQHTPLILSWIIGPFDGPRIMSENYRGNFTNLPEYPTGVDLWYSTNVGIENENENIQVVDGFVCPPIHQYELSVKKTGQGTVSSNPDGIICGEYCSYSYDLGTSVTLTATASTGYEFSGWGDFCGSSLSCTITMDEDKTVDANFIEEKVTLNINIRGEGSGTVSLNYDGKETFLSDGSIEVSKNKKITLNASAGGGSEFSFWQLSLDKNTCKEGNETGPVCTIDTGDSGGTVTARFNDVSDDNGGTTTKLRIRDIRWEEF